MPKDGGESDLSPQTNVRAVARHVSSEAGGELVILNLETGQYHGLEQVGRLVWNRIQDGATVQELEQAVLAEYAVEPERCRQDLRALLEGLRKRGLVEFRHDDSS